VFLTERYGDHSWSFDVTSDTSYEVRFYFAEIYHGVSTSSADTGDRVFDVSVEGNQVLDGYDIVAETGGAATATVETVEVTPSDGTIDVSFTTVTDNAKISAIEVVEAAPEPGVISGPSGVDFGTVVTGESTTETVTLTNEGESSDAASITVNGVSVTGTGASDFSTDFSGSTTLAPGETTDVTVTFTPSSAEAKFATLEVSHDAPDTTSPLTVDLSGEGSSSVPIGFGHNELSGFSTGNPTSLDWGPDGRLYVSNQNGEVFALTVQRNGEDDYEVTDTETIGLIQDIPNHNDDGSFGGPDNERQVTGLRAGGTADQPVVYVTSSDPRISVGNANPPEQSLDTNSGTISRLTQQSDGSWDHDVLLRGLPRSEENHAVNGLAIADGGDTLYVAVGGHTNQGAPGDKLSYLPEYALSAAILEVDVAQIENNNSPKSALDENGNTYAEYYYDIPTLSPDQSNAPNGGPFGGLDGVNMGKLVDGGPVQVYSPGYRNPYDVVIRPNGDLYTVDNGHNGGWGDQPVGEGTNQCTNEINDGGGGGANPLHHIDQQGYYGGHANPTRANPDGANVYAGGFQDNAGELLVDFSQNSPVEVPANPVECDWQAPGDDGALTTFGASTNGLGVYTADNFGGALEGALLAASFDGNTYYTTFNSDGTQVEEVEPQFSTGLSTPLDVTAMGDQEAYPGTVWVADFGGNDIDVYEPDDYGDSTGGGGEQCSGADDASLDEDGDGYDNADEIDAGTDPCSSSSTPADFDDDGTSNLNDPDDDNDGTPDTSDPFAIDPDDGTTTTAPIEYTFQKSSEPGTILDLGFTGLMTNGTDYQDLYDTENVIAGAAAPVLTIEDVPPGDAYQSTNTQQYAFQSGVQVNDEPLTVHTTLEAPFSSSPDGDGFRSQGVYIGNGDQDNYIKLVVTENAQTSQTPGLELLTEVDGSASSTKLDQTDVVGSKTVDLYLDVYPGNDTAVARYEITGNNIDGAVTGTLGNTSIPSSWLDSTDQGLAFGVISTSNSASTFGKSNPYTATYVQLDVTQQGANQAPSAAFTVSPTDPTAGEQVTFDAAGSSDSDGSIASYSWDLDGDGQEDATGQTATTIFSSAGDETVELTVTDDAGATATATQTVSVSEPSTTGEVQYRVNVGGQAITVVGGTDWSADTSGSASQYLASPTPDGGEIPDAQPYTVGSVDSSVPAGTPTEVFQTERYDPDASPNMEWNFPVQAGTTYEVRLHFHDGFDGTSEVGDRVFGVNIEEGSAELQEFDIIETYGDNTAATETFTVTPTDDTLNVTFLQDVQNPQVNGIEVIETEAANSPPSIDAISDQTVTEGESTTVEVSASDPDDDSLSLSLGDSSPGFASITDDGDGTGTLGLSPTDGSAGTYTLDVVADDGTATANESVTVTVEEPAPTGNYGVATGEATDVVIDTSTLTNASATVNGTLTLGGKDSATTYVRFYVQGQPEDAFWYTGESLTASGEFSFDVVLSPSTTYVWQALTQSGDGEWKAGAEKTFTTPAGQFFGVDTTGATDVGVESATLNGEVLNLGDNDNAQVYFTYWEQGQKESTLTWYTGPVQESAGPFSTQVGLDPGTTYEYRAFGQSDEGEWKAGPVETFTTQSGQPYGVATDAPSNVGAESATLNGELTGLGDYDSATVYFQYWKEDQKSSTLTWYTGSSQSSPGAYSAEVTLDPETTYVVQAYAQSNAGKWTAGSEQTLTTGTAANSAPSASFSVSPSAPTTGEQVTVDATGSSDSDGSIASYSWDFDGDGQEDATGQTATTTFSSAGDETVELTVTDDDGATATATETVTVSEPTAGEASATIDVTANSGVEASTYSGGSFVVTNTGEQNITSLSIDLSSATLPDMVFDPDGTAGDGAAKGLTIDDQSGGDGSVGVVSTADGDVFSQPHNGVNGSDGYDVLTIEFDDFEPGETVTFSADNDPTSIKGATIPSQEAGPVSGLELARATVTVEYDSTTQTTQTIGDGSQGGAEAVADASVPTAPSLSIVGVTLDGNVLDARHSAATVTDASQTVTVSGPSGANVTLVRVEGELELSNVPDYDGTPGYEIEDYEANKAEDVEYYSATVGSDGTVDVPVTLTNSTDVGGLNYLVAVLEDGDGAGLSSEVVVLELGESAPNSAPTVASVTDQGASQTESVAVNVSASDPDGDALSLSVSGPGFVSLTDDGDGTGTLELAPSDTTAVGTYQTTVTATDDAGASASESFAVYVDESDQDGTVVAAINAGGGSFTAADGTTYQADTNFTNGTTFSTGGAGTPTDPDIGNTVDDTLYQTERYGDFTYAVPVENGTYEVTLQFAEIFQGVSDTDDPDSSGPTDGTNENDRLFDASVEGQTVLTDYDIFSEVGPLNASDKQYTVEVTDGELNLEFSTVNDNAKISAIRVEQLDGGTANSPPTVDTIADQTVDEGNQTTVAVSASDPDGDSLTLSANGPSFVTLTDDGDGTGTLDITPSSGDAGTYTVEVVADDGNGGTATESFQLTVEAPMSSGTTAADVTVNSGSSNIDASTFNGGSFTVENTGDEPITSVTFDLSESVIPDAVFDPQGTAGDAGSKGLNIDSESGDGAGVVSTADGDVFSQPQNGVNGSDGYKMLTVEFTDFEPGETVAFSVDIDPTTIKNVETTGGEGSVSGLELSGSAVTVSSGSATVTNDLFTDGSQGGSQSNVTSDAASAPTLGVQGVTLGSTDFPNHAAATVSSQQQTLTLSGPAGATVQLLTLEASAPPSDGYDVDAFEADNAEAVSSQTVTLNSGGQATVQVSLSASNLNYFQAAVQDGSPTGAVSQTVVLELQTNTAPSIDAVSNRTVVSGETVTVPFSATDADGDSLTLSASAPAFVTLTDSGDGTGTLELAPGSADTGTYTVDVTADDGSTTSTESFQLTVDPATSVTAGTVLARMNAGESTTLNATDGGPDWTGVTDTSSQFLVSAATGQNGGNYAGGDTVTPGGDVPPSVPAGVYNAERFGEMTWEFNVSSGSEVEVRLYLSNQFSGADTDGDRQYNVSIDGQQVLTQYDPVQDVGDDTGTVKTFVVTEDGDGTITVSFEVGAAENPQVNAIEIVAVNGAGGN
jgi:hypothetical protein